MKSKGILAILAAYLAIAVAYSVVNPIHEATDEVRHYRFVRVLAETRSLPVQGEEACRSQSHHPPLYYALAALVTAGIDTGKAICETLPENPFWAYRYWEVGRDNKNLYLHGPEETFPWSGEALAAHVARLVNVLIGAGVVILTWLSGRLIWPRQPNLALGAAGLVAFNPMFLYMSAAINNDIIAALSGSAVVFAVLRLLANKGGANPRTGAALGVLFGLALLSKFNLAAIGILIEGAITWSVWRDEGLGETSDRLRRWIMTNLAFVLATGVVSGWWFVRNQLLYGEPTGFQRLTELWGVRVPQDSVGLAISELPYAWTTLWGRFGYGQIPLPESIYDGLKIITGLGIAGALMGFMIRLERRGKEALLVLAANIVLFFGVLFNYMLVSPAGPNGRFFFPALGSLALLTYYGLWFWSDLLRVAIVSRRQRQEFGPRSDRSESLDFGLALIANTALFALAAYVLVSYLAPAYARPPDAPVSAEISNPVNAQFDNLVTLLGYELSATTVQPGQYLDLDLFWEVNNLPPGNYLLFVHLIDDAKTMVVQRDTHPGLGNYPSSLWRPGERFQERIRLHLPETTYAPTNATLSIGLYAPDAFRLAISDEAGNPLGDALNLTTIGISPGDGDLPNQLDQNFENQARLLGYRYNTRMVPAGESVMLSLYWDFAEGLEEDPLFDLRVEDAAGNGSAVRVDFKDRQRQSGNNGYTLVTFELVFAPSAAAGEYSVDLALLEPGGSRRLNIIAEDGHWIGSHLSLARLSVRP